MFHVLNTQSWLIGPLHQSMPTTTRACVLLLIALLIIPSHVLSLGETSANHISNNQAAINQYLRECERNGHTFCSVPAHLLKSEDDKINSVIESDPQVLAEYERQRYEHLLEQISRRRRRRNAPRRDCTSVCCEEISMTQPFSHVSTLDGWGRIQSSDKYPQRTSFEQAKCVRENQTCSGVEASGAGSTKCVTKERTQTIYLYDSNTQNTVTRDINIAAGCVCQLTNG